jgi:hypothetical protein
METVMKIVKTLYAILGLGVSTIVTVWLAGSLILWVVDEDGVIAQDVLVALSTPWIGAPVHASGEPSK